MSDRSFKAVGSRLLESIKWVVIVAIAALLMRFIIAPIAYAFMNLLSYPESGIQYFIQDVMTFEMQDDFTRRTALVIGIAMAAVVFTVGFALTQWIKWIIKGSSSDEITPESAA